MGNFLTYSNKLRQYVPALSPEQAENYINDAWRDIRQANDEWSFLQATEYWLAPAAILLQGISVTQWSDDVSLDYAGMLQVAGLNNPAVTERQLRFGLSGGPIYGISALDTLQVDDGAITATDQTLTSATGPFFSTDVGKIINVAGAGLGGEDLQTTILTYTSATSVELTDAASTTVTNAVVTWGDTLTLDRVFNEGTNPNQSAQLYRILYSPLTTDFARLDHLYDPIMGYEFGYIIYPIDDLDRIDPQRASQLQPYQVFYRGFNPTTGLPVYELWPGPAAERAYTVSYWRQGLEFTTDTDALPPQISEELLLMRARMLAYEWGMVSDPDPKSRQSFQLALQYVRTRYSTEGVPAARLGLLDEALRRDSSISFKAGRLRGRRPGPGWPVDSNFLQSHAFPPGWSGY